MEDDQATDRMRTATPIEKQKLTIGAVCLLLGCVAGMGMKVGITSKTIDNLSDQITSLRSSIDKRDTDWRTEERLIYDRMSETKVKQEVQAGEINEIKMQLDRIRK